MSPFPDLKAVIDICRSHETAMKDNRILSGEVKIDRINKTKFSRSFQQVNKDVRQCGRCGGEFHPL